jgi:hypothetical protein
MMRDANSTGREYNRFLERGTVSLLWITHIFSKSLPSSVDWWIEGEIQYKSAQVYFHHLRVRVP